MASGESILILKKSTQRKELLSPSTHCHSWMWFLELRHQLLNRYKSLQADDDQYAVLAAMTLGDKSALNKELREVYSVTGASHVLALRGLHIGIILIEHHCHLRIECESICGCNHFLLFPFISRWGCK